jgi:hypothetical protein
MHVFGFTGGCYLGYKLPKLEEQVLAEANAMRQRRGLQPLVRTNSWWIHYRLPEDEEKAQIGTKY